MSDQSTRQRPSRHHIRHITRRTLVKSWDDSIFSESAQAAFWCALSLPPLLFFRDLLLLHGYFWLITSYRVLLFTNFSPTRGSLRRCAGCVPAAGVRSRPAAVSSKTNTTI